MRKTRIWIVVTGVTAALVMATSAFGVSAAGERVSRATTTKTVQIGDDWFSPTTLKVQKGTKVKWVNGGEDDHTITSSSNIFDEQVAPGQSFTFKFKKKGTFTYICRFHDDMFGKVKVTK